MGVPTFTDFRNSAGRDICNQLGIDLSTANDWAALKRVAAGLDAKELSSRAINPAGKLPSGEYMVLLATLTVIGLPLLADQLNHEETWGLLDVCDDKARLAVAAAVGRFD